MIDVVTGLHRVRIPIRPEDRIKGERLGRERFRVNKAIRLANPQRDCPSGELGDIGGVIAETVLATYCRRLGLPFWVVEAVAAKPVRQPDLVGYGAFEGWRIDIKYNQQRAQYLLINLLNHAKSPESGINFYLCVLDRGDHFETWLMPWQACESWPVLEQILGQPLIGKCYALTVAQARNLWPDGDLKAKLAALKLPAEGACGACDGTLRPWQIR